MTEDLWDKPVELMIENSDHFRRVSNTREAIACLATSWPKDRCKVVAAARKVCLKALDGKATSAQAQAAFLRAAEDAGILRHH
ncbi:DUF982 domain-containing protein [Neorhizobium sp. SOG26]|jgi:Protein of unknown function (DUF982).|uniref:DUF982 domain-containing protein n=1 Tax=Neorhizobium turbinariae TaxID=2937795 RepID=A0ABT0ILM5_9HYPH|nr:MULTISPECIES: DUF982 domain-containing protein [Neorhizobium]AXV16428.1 DUF982 domain-containing protein [Neorhizobium sp. SOG26]MCK8778774.1 DUF982 domain-containing protein [Neorhizobium turbinariae]